MREELKFFNLTYSGSFIEILKEELIDYFNLYNIITVYSPFKKTMYIWTGKRSTQTLKRHIASIRQVFSREFPDLNVLRYIKIESGSEPENFFELIDINEFELRKKLKNQETRLIPVISEINRLKDRADKLFIEENFEKAIQISKLIQDLAREIDDGSLINDQQNFIEEARVKNESIKIVNQIKEEARQLNFEIGKMNEDLEIMKINDTITEFLSKHKEHNIASIPSIQELILKAQRIEEKSQKEKIRLIDKLKDLDSQFNESLNHKHLEKARELLKVAMEDLDKLKNFKLNLKWKKNEDDFNYLKLKIKTQIQEKTHQMSDALTKRDVSQSLTILDEIIEELESIVHQ